MRTTGSQVETVWITIRLCHNEMYHVLHVRFFRVGWSIQDIAWRKIGKPKVTIHLLLCSALPPNISLLGNGKLETLALWQRYPWLNTLTNHENVRNTSSKSSLQGIFDVHDIETTNVLLTMRDNTSTTHVTTTSDHDNVARIELDEISELVLFNVKLDGVVDPDVRIGITDCSAVVGDDVGNTTSANCYFADFEELVGGFFGCDAVDGESALDVVKETEVLAGLLKADNVHESGGVGRICANFAIDFDEALLDNSSYFTSSQGIF